MLYGALAKCSAAHTLFAYKGARVLETYNMRGFCIYAIMHNAAKNR